MNNLEDICVSFETAKRLHDAGIEIMSPFRYDPKGNLCNVVEYDEGSTWLRCVYSNGYLYSGISPKGFIYAPTTDGLLKAMADIDQHGCIYTVELTKRDDKFVVYYVHYSLSLSGNGFQIKYLGDIEEHRNPCEALANLALMHKEDIVNEI